MRSAELYHVASGHCYNAIDRFGGAFLADAATLSFLFLSTIVGI